MKLVIIGNQSRAMNNFWTVLICNAIAKGHEVVAFLPDADEWTEKLHELGVKIRFYPLDRKGLNPLNDYKTVIALKKLLEEEKPDRLFVYTIKAVIYGSLAAALAKYPKKEYRYAMITGLGYAFEADSFLKKSLRMVAVLLYRLALNQVNTVFFQNQDDKELFEELHILPKNIEIQFSPGTGVDTLLFSEVPLPEAQQHFLLVARLLEAKGIRDFYYAAKIVKEQYPDTIFSILGPEENGVGGIPLSEVRDWEKEGVLQYLGATNDVRPYIAEASVMVLPSYREGTPCALLEGMSMGRAVLATKVPGCKEVVKNKVNGFLSPVQDPEALADIMIKFIEIPALSKSMGHEGRKFAEERFDANKVAENLLTHFKL
ncbi:glycosyltransferase family 4 protein [Desulfovibrio litoralis]|uniref:Glycosyltransferase involved in cell wall bisynthesis n=1 Tax=Desulfovibrio litoralis DSM 11393 TaxID=1121455 RepID=A0A1M7RWK3_9BACT|nr:glycosyltransferase family 4 protein [Desulfovibrio litoralis]SHN50747.1 Glycosyltransferase involved in cell wall bisynthesis [Desulfovibrio litoralis DSM 11393]